MTGPWGLNPWVQLPSETGVHRLYIKTSLGLGEGNFPCDACLIVKAFVTDCRQSWKRSCIGFSIGIGLLGWFSVICPLPISVAFFFGPLLPVLPPNSGTFQFSTYPVVSSLALRMLFSQKECFFFPYSPGKHLLTLWLNLCVTAFQEVFCYFG